MSGKNFRSRELRKGKTYEEIYGEEKAKELRMKKSIALKDKPNLFSKGKTYEELYGFEKAEILRKLRSKCFKSKHSKEHIQKTVETRKRNNSYKWPEKRKQERSLFMQTNNPMFGKHHSEETKRKIRIKRIERIEKNNGIVCPNYSPIACEFFKSFDEQHNTKGHYAMFGGGEHYIPELGYWLDYFNPDMKLIQEYDEPHHYDICGNLKERDEIRQKEIQKLYPDFEFRRIKE